jgi:hypothetical protein
MHARSNFFGCAPMLEMLLDELDDDELLLV